MESLQEPLTSDSEGSFVGAGSPRELQSPIGLHRTVVRAPHALYSRGRQPCFWRAYLPGGFRSNTNLAHLIIVIFSWLIR